MKISIFGLGYVGAVSLACLARDGHQVIGVDIDPVKLTLIREGRTPVVEEGMVELMARATGSGRVAVTGDVRSAVLESELSLICVGTPSASNGSQDQAAIVRLCRALGRAIREKDLPHVFVFRSTLTPASVETVSWSRSRASGTGRVFTPVSSPSSCARALRFATTTTHRLPW